MSQMDRGPAARRKAAFIARSAAYAALVVAAVAVPLALWPSASPLIDSTYGRAHLPFELFGLTASIAILAIAWLELARLRQRSFKHALPVVVATLVAFAFLTVVVEQFRRSWDYGCYERAARALLAGRDPYSDTAYIYPPLLAQLLAAAHRVVIGARGLVGAPSGVDASGWYGVFYLFQCAQFLAVNLVFLLLYRFARRLEIEKSAALALAAALMLCDHPLLRTLRHNQVNLYLVAIVLLATLWIGSRPLLSGVVVAVGAHLKLYPLLLALPMLLVRSWKALLGIAAGAAAVFLLQTRLGTDLRVWQQFWAVAGSFPRSHAFRDNSMQSVVVNLARFSLPPLGVSEAWTARVASWIVTAASLAVLAWFAARFLRREAAFHRLASEPGEALAGRDLSFFRLSGHVADCTALMLLVSPMVWEHHYVLVLPLAVWAVATRGPSRPWAIGLALVLMLAVPTFDVFLFSEHRIAGLLTLVALTPPHVLLPARFGR
jgi:hypothetical protein